MAEVVILMNFDVVLDFIRFPCLIARGRSYENMWGTHGTDVISLLAILPYRWSLACSAKHTFTSHCDWYMTNYCILPHQSAYWKFKNNLSFCTNSVSTAMADVCGWRGDKTQQWAFSAIAELLLPLSVVLLLTTTTTTFCNNLYYCHGNQFWDAVCYNLSFDGL